MSTQVKKQSKRAQRAAALKALRTAEGFLPQYSDFSFAKDQLLSYWRFLFSYLFIIFFIALHDIALAEEFVVFLKHVILWFIIIFVLYSLVLSPLLLRRRKKCGARLEEYNIVKTGLFGQKPPISYSVIEQAVRAGDIHYGKTGLQIGHGSAKLVFHYEIGDSKAQKHMEECHAILQRHLTSKLPPFEKKGLDLLDRRYFYKKSRRNHTLSLIGALLLFLLFYFDGISQLGVVITLAIIFCIWECISLYYLGANGKLSERNQAALQKEFADYPNARFGWRYTGYAYFILISVLVICANLLIITQI